MPNNTWERMVANDKDAFLAIYHEYYNSLFHYGFSITCDRELTKDCIQEVFLEIWKKRPSLKKEVENVRCYLCTWLRRKISRHINKLSRQKTGDVALDADVVESSYEDLLIAFQHGEEKKETVSRALCKLTKKQVYIIRLKFFENLSYPAIAERTSLSPRTIYNLIYEAIHQLREDESLVLHM